MDNEKRLQKRRYREVKACFRNSRAKRTEGTEQRLGRRVSEVCVMHRISIYMSRIHPYPFRPSEKSSFKCFFLFVYIIVSDGELLEIYGICTC